MKHINVSSLLLLFICLWGCSIDNPKEDETILDVYAENGIITRQEFDSKGNFYWSATDVLGVTSDKSHENLYELKLVSGAGTAHAKFKSQNSTMPEGYAVYPYNINHYFEGNTLNYFLPDTYICEKIDENLSNAPMWGAIQNESVLMHHLGGIICIKINDLPIGDNLKLTISSAQRMNGYFTADLTAESPVISTEKADKDEDKTVTYTFRNQQNKKTGVFYVPIPTGTYERTRIKLYKNQQQVSNIAVRTFIINRSNLMIIEIQNSEIGG